MKIKVRKNNGKRLSPLFSILTLILSSKNNENKNENEKENKNKQSLLSSTLI